MKGLFKNPWHNRFVTGLVLFVLGGFGVNTCLSGAFGGRKSALAEALGGDAAWAIVFFSSLGMFAISLPVLAVSGFMALAQSASKVAAAETPRPKDRWRKRFVFGVILVIVGGFGANVGMTDGLGNPEERSGGPVRLVKAVLGDRELFEAYVFASYIALFVGIPFAAFGGLILFLDRFLKPNEPPSASSNTILGDVNRPAPTSERQPDDRP